MTSVGRFNLKTLMSACIHLARRGGNIIAEEQRKGQLGSHNKKIFGDNRSVVDMPSNEVLTVADNRAQDAIVTSLRVMFPNLRIVGEEGEVPGVEHATVLEDVPLLEHIFEVPQSLQESLTSADTCLWIDPLDGTKEFVLGNLENVSVLIGIAVKDRPVAGVMYQPFVGDGNGIVTYGAVGVGVFGDGRTVVGDVPTKPIVLMSPKTSKETRIVRAIEKMTPTPEIVLSNACGNKLLQILRGQASVFLMGAGPSRWDTCAGEALLMAVSGKLTTLDGNLYTYIQHGQYENEEGHIASRSPELHALFIDLLDTAEALDEPVAKVQRVDSDLK